MKNNLKLKAVLVVLVISISAYFIITKGFSKGLDIAGGTHFTIEVMLNDLPEDQREDAIERTLAIYRNRIDEIGVAETTVQRSGENKIIVQIPGVDTKEADRIKDILKRQAHLEFRLVVDGPLCNNVEN